MLKSVAKISFSLRKKNRVGLKTKILHLQLSLPSVNFLPSKHQNTAPPLELFASFSINYFSFFWSRARDSISRSIGRSVRRSVRPSLLARSTRLMAIGLVSINHCNIPQFVSSFDISSAPLRVTKSGNSNVNFDLWGCANHIAK